MSLRVFFWSFLFWFNLYGYKFECFTTAKATDNLLALLKTGHGEGRVYGKEEPHEEELAQMGKNYRSACIHLPVSFN